MLNTSNKQHIIKPLHEMVKHQGHHATALHMRKYGASLDHALYALRVSNQYAKKGA